MTDIHINMIRQALARAGFLEEDARIDREYGFNGFTGERCLAVSFDDIKGPTQFLMQLGTATELAGEMTSVMRLDSLGERCLVYFPGFQVWGPISPYDEPDDDEIGINTSQRCRLLSPESLAELVERVKGEILDDIGKARSSQGEIMPLTVGRKRGYSELHDYVDANEYGGATEEGNTLTLGDVIAMQDAVDVWLRRGGPALEKVAELLYRSFGADADDTAWENLDEGVSKGYYRDVAKDLINLLIPSEAI